MSNYSNTQNGWSSADHWNTALNSQDGGEQRAQYDDVAGPAYGLAFSGFPTGPTAPFNSNVNYASQAPPVYHYTNSQQASRAVLEAAQMLPMASFTPVANGKYKSRMRLNASADHRVCMIGSINAVPDVRNVPTQPARFVLITSEHDIPRKFDKCTDPGGLGILHTGAGGFSSSRTLTSQCKC